MINLIKKKWSLSSCFRTKSWGKIVHTGIKLWAIYSVIAFAEGGWGKLAGVAYHKQQPLTNSTLDTVHFQLLKAQFFPADLSLGDQNNSQQV